ncbi:membrane-spanning 4-domains subfamily A member 4D-like [Pleurodeles waltl]|uniref:membrane-spanning 4-domains subfamily A member 4D-like n=1 Tax=Pleurodeles waltl TaxID=8319 RepID=UPI0037097C71
MSTSAADPGGFVVITEISPKTNQGDPSQTGQAAKTASNKHLQKFFKGEPLVLGVVQILNGIFQIGFGIVGDSSSGAFRSWTLPLFITGVPYWSGILYIISGSLSVAAANNPKISLVRGCLIMNILSAVASGIAVIVYIIYIAVWDHRGGYGYTMCNYYYREQTPEEMEQCMKLHQVHLIFWASLILLLIITILELCVSISVAAFGCKTVCRMSYSEVTVVIYQNTAPSPAHQPNPDVSASLTSQPALSEILSP